MPGSKVRIAADCRLRRKEECGEHFSRENRDWFEWNREAGWLPTTPPLV